MNVDFDRCFQLAMAHQQAGRLRDAEDLHRRILAFDPVQSQSWHLVGLLAYQAGATRRAVSLIARAIIISPGIAGFYGNLGMAARAAGLPRIAFKACRAALSADPAFAPAHYNLGNWHAQDSAPQTAVAAFARASMLGAADMGAYDTLGKVFRASNLREAAVRCYLGAVALGPDESRTYNNLGNLIRESGRIEDAERWYRRSLTLKPDIAETLANLGSLWRDSKKLDFAVGLYRRATVMEPGLGALYRNLCNALTDQGWLAEAAKCGEMAVAVKPEDIAAFRNLLNCSGFRDDVGAEEWRALHERFGRSLTSPPEPLPLAAHRPTLGEKLRIGYLSSDFRVHPVGSSMLQVLRSHDRQQFSIYCYAEVAQPDPITDEFRAAAESWCDSIPLTDAALAERIRADGIHILVCLAGRFDRNRPQIAAWRAAPVQVSLHDVGTSGLAAMDYIIGDRWLLSRRSNEYFSERQLRLPHFYLGELPKNLPQLDIVGRDGPPVFGCCNNPSKITPTALRLWGKILAARPDARLVLKYLDRYSSPTVCQRIVNAMTAAGAKPHQIDMATQGKETVDRFLSQYNTIDVALDTVPFSGSTTSFQALAMGVPVVTWPWDRMVSRWTEAMLRTLDLPELIADSADTYVAIALRLAEERAVWRQRRSEMRHLVETRLCDGKPWTRHLERLYKALWQYHNFNRPALDVHYDP